MYRRTGGVPQISSADTRLSEASTRKVGDILSVGTHQPEKAGRAAVTTVPPAIANELFTGPRYL
jgi:hypothetical protein